jgi:FkbM family methyltransferase
MVGHAAQFGQAGQIGHRRAATGCVRRLAKKIRNNRRVPLHNLAIGERESVETLKITRDTTGASLLQPREEMRAVIGSNWTITSEVEVNMTTLDRLLADLDEISLLKIDVQDYEKHVLVGAKQILSKTKFLLVELNFMPQYDGRFLARRYSPNPNARF